jgi:ABC-type branched-subunit amino acid transport system substrate-binding protein
VDGPVTVYVSLPLSGPRAPEGRDAADGARLALEPADGRTGDLEVRATFLDDAKGAAWDPVAVGANARRAAQDSSAVAYIGELDSEPTRASVPITNDAGMVQVSPTAGALDLTRPADGVADSPDRYQPSGTPTFARIVPADDVVDTAAASWAAELGVNRVPVQFDGEAPGAKGGYAVAAVLDPARLPDRSFAGQFEARFNRPAGPFAAYGYEAMALVLQAIEQADTGSDQFRIEVRDGVIGGERRESVLGPYSITDEGDSTVCMVQRYRLTAAGRAPLDAPCPPR